MCDGRRKSITWVISVDLDPCPQEDSSWQLMVWSVELLDYYGFWPLYVPVFVAFLSFYPWERQENVLTEESRGKVNPVMHSTSVVSKQLWTAQLKRDCPGVLLHNARQHHLSQVSDHQTEENIYPVGQNEFQNDVHLVGVKTLCSKVWFSIFRLQQLILPMEAEPVEILVVFVLLSW